MTTTEKKPDNCTCEWPEKRHRNVSGHDPSCPVHVAFFAEIEPSTYGRWIEDVRKVLAEDEVNFHAYKIHVKRLVRMFMIKEADIPAMWRRSVVALAAQDDKRLELEMHRVRSILRTIPWKCNKASEFWLSDIGKEES
jgi:DNA polymerase III delta prime subunit